MNIVAATQSYEAWLATQMPLHLPDLRYKHLRMSDPTDPFPFFRATYHRWLQHWPTLAKDYDNAPRVLAVGDAHLENFGTWRDAEGRLVWGVNDFDETAELPYTHDLIRLAASVRLARRSGVLQVGFRAACRAILRGYLEGLNDGGTPFVLEERHRHLRRLATTNERAPHVFWRKYMGILKLQRPTPLPKSVAEALAPSWPEANLIHHARLHERVGVGSLGKPRYLVLSKWNGSWMAREAKALSQPANAWSSGISVAPRVAELLANAVRCHDPYFRTTDGWIVRRLAARCSRIELQHLTAVADEEELFKSMGGELANLHLGTTDARTMVLADLVQRPKGWLGEGAKIMAKAIKRDWKEWRTTAAAGIPLPTPR